MSVRACVGGCNVYMFGRGQREEVRGKGKGKSLHCIYV